MTDSAIADTSLALQARIVAAVGPQFPVHIGAPVRSEIGSALVTLFLFHCEVNAALRNEMRTRRPPANQPPQDPLPLENALPMDLRFLITVFRHPSASGTKPNELEKLGRIISELHARPTLHTRPMQAPNQPNQPGGQVVRVSPEPYPMEELSRIWGLLGQDIYRTSVVYLASPVFVESNLSQVGRPVVERRQSSGEFVEPVGGQ